MRRSQGFGLVETILALIAGGLLIAGAITLAGRVSANFDAHETSDHIVELTEAIVRSYSAMGSFAGVSASSIVAQNLLPSGMEAHGRSPATAISTAYGGLLLVQATTIDGQAGRGFSLTLTDVPKKICAQLVGEASLYGFQAITVDGHRVLDAGGKLEEDVLSRACSARNTSTVAFTLDRSFTSTRPTSTACVLPSPATQVLVENCPSGYIGSITHTRTAACLSGAALPTWGDWSVSRSCEAACAPAVHSPQVRRSTPCPPGQIGSITEHRVSACPGSTGQPVWSEWVEVANTCGTQCAAPADEMDVASPCPPGQAGTIVRRRSATCPATTGSWHWNAWQEVSNTCV